MIGIVLASHGRMCEGMIDSAKLFFGDDIPQLVACPLFVSDSPEAYDEKLKQAIKEVDMGDGVLVMVDLMSGTPSNRCSYLVSEKVQIITGMNFTMLLEVLGSRSFQTPDIHVLMDVGRTGINSLNEVLLASACDIEE